MGNLVVIPFPTEGQTTCLSTQKDMVRGGNDGKARGQGGKSFLLFPKVTLTQLLLGDNRYEVTNTELSKCLQLCHWCPVRTRAITRTQNISEFCKAFQLSMHSSRHQDPHMERFFPGSFKVKYNQKKPWLSKHFVRLNR